MLPGRLVFLRCAFGLAGGLAMLGACAPDPRRVSAAHAAQTTEPDAAAASDGPPTRSGQRWACDFDTGALAADTLNPSDPIGDQIPIDHFIVIMQENRSFDHYFEMLPDRGQPNVDVAPQSFTNPAAAASPTEESADPAVSIYHETEYCIPDIEHGWDGVHQQYANGAMNGFVVASNGATSVMGYFDDSDLPYYYALANTFAIGDRYFSDVMGPTFPNRMYAVAGSSFGLVDNGTPPSEAEAEAQTIFHRLQAAGLDFRVYADKPTFEEKLFPDLRSEPGDHFGSIARFATDAASGALPELSWVESRMMASTDGTNEHPPADVQLGQRFVSHILSEVMQSSAWASSAVFLIYDEHGGFFDHVPPPHACPPDAVQPMLTVDTAPGGFDRLGFRVPFIVVAPFAKPHYVSHHVFSHGSLLRLIEARYNLPAVSARTANAEPPFDLFDFSQAPFAVPPTLPTADVDKTELSRCQTAFP
jgi:phospholipase C